MRAVTAPHLRVAFCLWSPLHGAAEAADVGILEKRSSVVLGLCSFALQVYPDPEVPRRTLEVRAGTTVAMLSQVGRPPVLGASAVGSASPPAPGLTRGHFLLNRCISQLGCGDKRPQTGGLKQWTFISHSSGAWKSEVKCHQVWFVLRLLPLACGLLPLTVSSVHAHSSCLCLFL